jgi:hypothetical protein
MEDEEIVAATEPTEPPETASAPDPAQAGAATEPTAPLAPAAAATQPAPTDDDALAERLTPRLLAKLQSELEERDRRIDGRMSKGLEDVLGELNKANRSRYVEQSRKIDIVQAEARKMYLDACAYADKTYDRLVTQGLLPADEAERQKQAEKSQAHVDMERRIQQAAEQTQAAPTAAAQPSPPTPADVLRKWDKTWQGVAKEYDLSADDPEWKDFQSIPIQGADFDDYVASLRKGARLVSKKKEKREAQALAETARGKEQDQAQAAQRRKDAAANAVPIDSGGGNVPGPAVDPQVQLDNLMNKEPPSDPKALRAYQKLLKTLNERLAGTG